MTTKRDYRYLSDEESLEFKAIKDEEIVSDKGLLTIRKSLFHEYSKAARHNMQLFPNHYLDIMDLRRPDILMSKANEFNKILNIN